MEELATLVGILVAAVGSAGAVELLKNWLLDKGSASSKGDADRVQKADFEEVLRAATQVRTIEEPSAEPSSPAKEEAIVILRAYSRDLLGEAGRIAKRAGADHSSKTHVREAAGRIGILRSRAGAISDVLVVLGGILVGGAISYQVNLWTGGTPAKGAGFWAALALGAGIGLVVSGTAAKWYKR